LVQDILEKPGREGHGLHFADGGAQCGDPGFPAGNFGVEEQQLDVEGGNVFSL